MALSQTQTQFMKFKPPPGVFNPNTTQPSFFGKMFGPGVMPQNEGILVFKGKKKKIIKKKINTDPAYLSNPDLEIVPT